MKKENDRPSLMNRRDFLKAGGKVLPVLAGLGLAGAVAARPAQASCACGGGCGGTCSSGCGGTCSSGCGGTCSSGCGGTCSSGCGTTAS